MHELTKQEGKNKIQSTFGVNTWVAPIDLSTRVASLLPSPSEHPDIRNVIIPCFQKQRVINVCAKTTPGYLYIYSVHLKTQQF